MLRFCGAGTKGLLQNIHNQWRVCVLMFRSGTWVKKVNEKQAIDHRYNKNVLQQVVGTAWIDSKQGAELAVIEPQELISNFALPGLSDHAIKKKCHPSFLSQVCSHHYHLNQGCTVCTPPCQIVWPWMANPALISRKTYLHHKIGLHS